MEISVKFFVLILVALLHKPSMATKHGVGGSQGWDESTDFDSWASAQTFKVGDELEFKYTPGLHSVVELPNESAFKKCDIGVAMDTLNGGSNKVKLSKQGTRYFACGTSGHCEQGMKVKITTVAADGSSTATTGAATSPPDAASSSAGPSGQLRILSSFAVVASLVVFSVLFV